VYLLGQRKMSTKKYRPYFTLAELKTLEFATQTGSTFAGVNKYLRKYISDIEHSFRKENHTLKPTMEERLGFSPIDEPEIESDLEAVERLLNQRLKKD
jgi:hypothetical protein